MPTREREEDFASLRASKLARLTQSLAASTSQPAHRGPKIASTRVKKPDPSRRNDYIQNLKTIEKPKPPRVFKPAGDVTQPVERDQVAPPPGAPPPSRGWISVYYSDIPAPNGKVFGQFKGFKPKTQLPMKVGLEATLKRPAEKILYEDAEEEASEEDIMKMEQWLVYAREKLEEARRAVDNLT